MADDSATQKLRELADAEVAAAKHRLATRTAAAKRFATAEIKRADAARAWEAAQGEALEAKRAAVEELLASELKSAEVAQLLAIDQREVRALRSPTAPARNGSTTTPPQTAGQGN